MSLRLEQADTKPQLGRDVDRLIPSHCNRFEYENRYDADEGYSHANGSLLNANESCAYQARANQLLDRLLDKHVAHLP